MSYQNICILGMGYIGLPTACSFASAGKKVLGVDTNPQIINVLRNGKIHIHEEGLAELAKSACDSHSLTVDTKPATSDAFIIAVPTPFYDGKKADLRAVKSAAEAILPVLREGNLVILESTSPPQTTSVIVREILEKSGLKAGIDFNLAYSPERVLPGRILYELVNNDRVIGGYTSACAEAGKELYSCFVKGNIFTTTSTTAEMVKLMENTYRDVNIAIANEFMRIADEFDVNIWDAIELANKHPRVKILKPGIGVGGHCISVDPWFLVEATPDNSKLIKQARNINDGQPEFVLENIRHHIPDLQSKKIGLLGLTYKPDVDDFRESPAVEFAHLLKRNDYQFISHDPFYSEIKGDLGFPVVTDLTQLLNNCDLLILLVSHSEYKNVQLPQATTGTRIICDCLAELNQQQWEAAGYQYKKMVG